MYVNLCQFLVQLQCLGNGLKWQSSPKHRLCFNRMVFWLFAITIFTHRFYWYQLIRWPVHLVNKQPPSMAHIKTISGLLWQHLWKWPLYHIFGMFCWMGDKACPHGKISGSTYHRWSLDHFSVLFFLVYLSASFPDFYSCVSEPILLTTSDSWATWD